jgi:hypothetical protein
MMQILVFHTLIFILLLSESLNGLELLYGVATTRTDIDGIQAESMRLKKCAGE